MPPEGGAYCWRGAIVQLQAGQSVSLPLPDQGFVCGVSEPAGASRLVAIPSAAPPPAIVAENTCVRSIQPIPEARLNDFAVSVSSALDGGAQAVAFSERAYQVTR